MTKRAWKAPVEVSLSEMKPNVVIDRQKFEFYRDVEMRMSQTSNAAIRYEFADEKTAREYQLYACRVFRKKHGNGILSSRIQAQGDVVYAYFAPMKGKKQ